MSSMLRLSPLLLSFSALTATIALTSPALADDGREWDVARAQAAQSHDMAVHQSIDRWKLLLANDRLGFGTYAGFLLTYPGYPQEEKIRGFAEKALLTESPDAPSVIGFFDRFKPITSQAAGRYATALHVGHYDNLRDATAHLLDWGQQQGLHWDVDANGAWRADEQSFT